MILRPVNEIKTIVENLGSQGYKFKVTNEGYANVFKPDNTVYKVDTLNNTCTCPAIGNCKHLDIVTHTRPCELHLSHIYRLGSDTRLLKCWGIQYLCVDNTHSIYRPTMCFECDVCKVKLNASVRSTLIGKHVYQNRIRYSTEDT